MALEPSIRLVAPVLPTLKKVSLLTAPLMVKVFEVAGRPNDEKLPVAAVRAHLDSRREQRIESHIVAGVRHMWRVVCVGVARNVGVIGLDTGNGFMDLNRYDRGLQRQLQVHGGYLPDLDLHDSLRLREISRLRGEQVIAGREQGKAVIPCPFVRALLTGAGPIVCQGYGRLPASLRQTDR